MEKHRFSLSLTPLLATILAIGCGAALPEKDSSGLQNVIYGSRVHKMPKRDSGVTPDSAPSGAHLTYYGGRVNSATKAIVVLWGSGSYESHVTSSGTPSMLSFYNQVLSNGSYASWLDSEYNTVNNNFNGTNTNQHIGNGAGVSVVQITPSTSATTVDDSVIQSELAAQIQAGHLPAPQQDSGGNDTSYYAVFFPHGVTITQGGSNSCQAGGFCAYHGTIQNAGGHEVYYGVHPDMQAGSGCDTGCGSASTAFGNYTSVASHELTEMITDAEVGLAQTNGPPLAWYDSTNGEIGDICNAQQGTYTGCDGQSYTIQLEFSNAQNNCIPYAAPSCGTQTNDFSISAASSSLTISSGSSGTDSIHTAVVSGSAESISLSASGQPSGVTVSFSPASVSSGASSTMTVTAASTASAGTYNITVTGTAASGSHTTSVSLTVTSTTTTNDFSISASPASVSFAPGGSGTSTISTAVVSGSPKAVALSASGQPSGVTVSFNPTSVNVGSSSTATISSTSAAAAGSYTITVTGTDSSATHTTSIALTISGGGGGGGGITNGGFESGSLNGWTASGAATGVSTTAHSGSYSAMLGSTSPTNGDSSIAQTFTAPSNATGISLYYEVFCPDTITYDWATATLKDNTAGTTATLVAPTCTNGAGWVNATGSLTAGHSYTLTLTSHDDDYAADPTYTLYDDVTITTGGGGGGGGGITNGGFETGTFSGWTTSGAATSITTVAHSGSYAALLGSTSPTNGDSTIKQTFTAPSGVSHVSFWYAVRCPDTVTYDWFTASLKDNTSGTTTTLVGKTCPSSYTWTNKTGNVTAGHSYTITITSHDDDYAADPTYSLVDDVTLQ